MINRCILAEKKKKGEKEGKRPDILNNLFITIAQSSSLVLFNCNKNYNKYLKCEQVSTLTVSWMPAHCI